MRDRLSYLIVFCGFLVGSNLAAQESNPSSREPERERRTQEGMPADWMADFESSFLATGLSRPSGSGSRDSRPSGQEESPGNPAAALPGAEEFRRNYRNRRFVDEYQARSYPTRAEGLSSPRALVPSSIHTANGLRIVQDRTSPWRLSDRITRNPPAISPGFRPSLGDSTTGTWPPPPINPLRIEALRIASRAMREHLGADGLLNTLVLVLEELCRDGELHPLPQLNRELNQIGFPLDWLEFFVPENADPATQRGSAADLIVGEILKGISYETAPAQIQRDLRSFRFQFVPSQAGFRATPENGRHDISMVRLQIGGGYRDGVVPGGAIDLASQLVRAMPTTRFMISLPRRILPDFRRMVEFEWPVRFPGQLTLITEPVELSAWAQDNGKGGLIVDGQRFSAALATLAPRFASVGEEPTRFVAGDSFAANGWRAAGHRVVSSPLLFQGGNLLVIQEPATRRYVMLIGEAEVIRNRMLGLSRAQVIEAFRVEFGVDQCVAVPSASFHLDHDVTVRSTGVHTFAFVNDPNAAARLVLLDAIPILEGVSVLDAAHAAALRTACETGNDKVLHRLLAEMDLPARVNGRYPPGFIRAFAIHPRDSAAFNCALFLTAMDMIAAAVPRSDRPSESAVYTEYLSALSEVLDAARTQRALLATLDWKIVPVPSFLGLEIGLNFLNGLHDRTHFWMPIGSSLYRSLNEAARRAFREGTGGNVRVRPVITTECQQNHGGLHCAAAAYGDTI